MSGGQLDRGLRDALDRWARDGRLEAIPIASLRVEQVLELARVNWERVGHLRGALPSDFDWQYETGYKALIEGCDALLASLGYRLKGGESSHDAIMEVAAFALAPQDAEVAKLLYDGKDHFRRQRRQMVYDRVRVVTERECEQFLGQAARILEAIELNAYGRVDLKPEGNWSLPAPR